MAKQLTANIPANNGETKVTQRRPHPCNFTTPDEGPTFFPLCIAAFADVLRDSVESSLRTAVSRFNCWSRTALAGHRLCRAVEINQELADCLTVHQQSAGNRSRATVDQSQRALRAIRTEIAMQIRLDLSCRQRAKPFSRCSVRSPNCWMRK